jgi:AhpD family alkylhydroperoxidase
VRFTGKKLVKARHLTVSLTHGNTSNTMTDRHQAGSQWKRKESEMEHLSSAERELVALGAAMGSNCIPCIEYHVPEARKAGLSDAQISEAIKFADQVRQVPARKILATANALLPGTPATPDGGEQVAGCGQAAAVDKNAPPCCS